MRFFATVAIICLSACANARTMNRIPIFCKCEYVETNDAPAVTTSTTFGPSDVGAFRIAAPVFRFAVVSDMHYSALSSQASSNYSKEKTESAISKLKARGIGSSDIYNCGDMNFSSYTRSDMSSLRSLLNPFCGCYATGNHDSSVEPAELSSVFGESPSAIISNDFAVMTGFPMKKGSRYTDDAPFDLEMIDNAFSCFEKPENSAKAKIVFMHFPIPVDDRNPGAGLRPFQVYGFSDDSYQDNYILSELKRIGNTIVFSGHTHYTFETQDEYPNIIVSRIPSSTSWLVHVPSLSQPKDKDFNLIRGIDAPVEALVVSVFPDRTELQGVNLSPVTANDTVRGDDLEYRWTIPIGSNVR